VVSEMNRTMERAIEKLVTSLSAGWAERRAQIEVPSPK